MTFRLEIRHAAAIPVHTGVAGNYRFAARPLTKNASLHKDEGLARKDHRHRNINLAHYPQASTRVLQTHMALLKHSDSFDPTEQAP